MKLFGENRKGFTLIELLVVIAIIAILAAILFPVFVSAKEKGKQASCQSNAKQMASAMIAYMSDFSDTYPRGCVTKRIGGKYTYTFWADFIDSYVKNKRIRECPSLGKIALNGYPWAQLGVGVGANIGLCNSEVGAGLPLAVRASRLASPTRTVLLADGSYIDSNDPGHRYGHWGVTGYPNYNSVDFNPLGSWLYSFVAYRHQGLANVVFADGHATAMSETRLMPKQDVAPNTGSPKDSLWDWN